MYSGQVLQKAVSTLVKNPLKAWRFASSKLVKKTVVENSSFCWVKEDEEFSTVLYLYNYWSENYKIQEPVLNLTLLDSAGKDYGVLKVRLLPDETRAIPVSELMQSLGVSKPFEGSVLAMISEKGLVENRPFQMNVDYFYAGGKKVTAVHSQGGFALLPDGEIQTSFHISADPKQDTFLIVRNSLNGDGFNKKTFSPVITLLNHKGEQLQAKGPSIAPKQVVRISVKNLFPQAEDFLESKPGNAEIRLGAKVLRNMFYIYDEQIKTYCFNHATEHKTADTTRYFTPEQVQLMGIGPVGVNWVLDDGSLHTRLIPCINLCEGEKSYYLDLAAFYPDGSLALSEEKVSKVSKGEVPVIEFPRLLKKHKVRIPFEGTFRLSIHHSPEIKKYPSGFSYITEYYDKARWTAIQFDSGLFNMPNYNLAKEFQTTKVFSRVIYNNDFYTSIGLVNPSGETGCNRISNTNVRLLNAKGDVVGEKTIQLPTNSSVWVDLKEWFPDIEEHLKDSKGIGTVKVRDRTCRVIGFHFVDDCNKISLAGCHMFGG